jgi:hypothetical protein
LTQASTCTLFVEGLLVKCTKDITCVECEWEDYVGEGRMNREQCCVAGLLSALLSFNYWIKPLKITMNSSTTCCFNEESDMNKELHASTPKLAK